MSNSLDPDQAQHFVRPDLGPNFLQRFSAGEKKLPLAGKELMAIILGIFLGLIWGGTVAPPHFKNKQTLPKIAYIIPNFFVLHSGENFMKN